MDRRTFCREAWATISGTPHPARYPDFLPRLIAGSQMSKSNLAIALHYLRLYLKNSINQLDHTNPLMANAVIVAALILSNKIFDDHCYTITTWLNMVNQIPDHPPFTTKLLTGLEVHFLSVVDYRVLLHLAAAAAAVSPIRQIQTPCIALHPHPGCTEPSVRAPLQTGTPESTLVPTPLQPTFRAPVPVQVAAYVPCPTSAMPAALPMGPVPQYLPLTPQTPAYDRPNKRHQPSPVFYKRPRLDTGSYIL